MPSWGQIIGEIENNYNDCNVIRRKYLEIMGKYTDRNVLAYYSAFLQKPDIDNTGISDIDKNAFMECVHKLDKSKGLDLILHTPGGNIAATESIVAYLKKSFGNDIRVFVPQIAMSAGTMIALSSKEIVMGKQSNLGPIDPQFGGMSCAGIIEEFESAINDIQANPAAQAVWVPIISKYHPTFLGDCKKAVKWAEQMVGGWLKDNMFASEPNGENIANSIVAELSSHQTTYSHNRHIDSDTLKAYGVKIVDLETMDNRQIDGCNDLQDCVLSIHHAYMRTFEMTNSAKIVETHNGGAMVIKVK